MTFFARPPGDFIQFASEAEAQAGVAIGKAVDPAGAAALLAVREIVTGGLATGGGDLSGDRTITVLKSSVEEARAGIRDDVGMTPLTTKEKVDSALNAIQRTLESFGPCGNGVQADDHAAWLQAQTWCANNDTVLLLCPNKRYLLDFRFTVKGGLLRTRTPYFRLVARGAEIKLIGADSGVLYQGIWQADKGKTEFCAVYGGIWFPSTAGDQTAFEANFRYNPSLWFKNCVVDGMMSGLDNPNDATVFWKHFIRLHNAWLPTVTKVLAFQPFNKRSGDAFLFSGLTVGVRMQDVSAYWFENGVHCTFEKMRGLLGSFTSGSGFFTGEKLVGQTSGVEAYACVSLPYPGHLGGSCPVSVQDADGSASVNFTVGETVVGTVSGAVFQVSGAEDTYQSMEAVYASDFEFVFVNRGFFFDNSSPVSFTKQIGHSLSNGHINSYNSAIEAINTFQVKIALGLWQAAADGWIGIIMVACDQWDIGSALQIHGQGRASTTGIFMVAGCNNSRIDASLRFCSTGMALGDANTLGCDFGLSFSGCADDINNNGSPVLPAANGNSYWRTVSRTENFVGGYNV